MSCLGERLTALIDDELDPAERDRVLAHLAGCADCRAEADELRRVKGRLRGLSAIPASDGADDLPSGDFLNRLRSMGGDPGATAPEPPAATQPMRPAAHPRPLRSSVRPVRTAPAARPRDNRPGARAGTVTRHRRRYLVVGAATLFIGLGTASYAAGGRQQAPTVTPAFDRFAVEHALTTGDAPVTDPLTDPANQIKTAPGP
ncbi:zf-HC2 domain-containing protein [Actinomadura verrucosospora]|uniref:Putative transmembrane anti-sigma factor n=1 Tax=Actinomadura verrucosospora TaxID=46165 RepID=A0A7D3VY80_ACTVE|nr:zf-HC2 domain-containing protein [Actinomadura verrucosospora]QKG21712.1 putative transmembrane anti-sigma factor [Actinomadura verrucosospora]